MVWEAGVFVPVTVSTASSKAASAERRVERRVPFDAVGLVWLPDAMASASASASAAFAALLLRPRFLGVVLGMTSAGSERLVAASSFLMRGSKKRTCALCLGTRKERMELSRMASTSRSRVKVHVRREMLVKRTSSTVTLSAGCCEIFESFRATRPKPCRSRFDADVSRPTALAKSS